MANLLIASLDDGDRARLEPLLETVELSPGQILARPGSPAEHVFFPDSGVVSIAIPDETQMSIGLIGREGFIGLSTQLLAESSPYLATVEVDRATAQRVSTSQLTLLTRESEGFRTRLLHFGHSFLVQVAQNGVSAATDNVGQRIARMLLMLCDRSTDDRILIVHQQIADMLGVQRTSVTSALHLLEDSGSVRLRRGVIQIVDHEALKARAGRTYGVAEEEYRRLFGHGVHG